MRYNTLFNHRQPAWLVLYFILFSGLNGYGQRWVYEHAQAVITPFMMQQTIGYLASDSLKGRATPSPGLDSAGNYIARQFESFGLKPLNGSYFQDLNYCYYDLGKDIFLSLVKDLKTKNYEIKKDYIPFEFSGTKPAEGDLVFAGYGITAPEYKYDDYQDIDVKGKIVVVLRLEPGQNDPASKIFKGEELTRYSALNEKQKTAKEHGAIGMLVVSGPLNYVSLKPKGFSWPSLSLPGTLPKDALPIDYCGREKDLIPMVAVGEAVINDLFTNTDTLKRLQQHIEQDMHPHSFPIPGKSIVMNISLTGNPVGGRNVIGYLEGSDPVLKNEVVIIGGHYDHIGCLREYKADSDYIYNGADDNASGTSGVLAVAKAFASMPDLPKRSVICIAFAGEEKGLLGSKTYIKEPSWPLDKTVAMLNLDMISRNSPDTLEIIGAKQNPGLMKIVRKQNIKPGFVLAESKANHMGGGSDRAGFFKKDIPAIFFFTGLHKDYHKLTDSPDRIDAKKAAHVARLAFLTAWTVANEHRYYKIVKEKDQEEGW
jgi:hypothetical protein